MDRRKAQSDRVLSVLGEADEAPAQKSRGGGCSDGARKKRLNKRQEKETKMTSEIYYPEQRHLLGKTAIRRERFLPDTTQRRSDGQVGDARFAAAMSWRAAPSPAPYVLIEAARYFNLKDPDKLFDLLEVRIGEQVERRATCWRASAVGAGKRLTAPVAGQVVDITQGRIVLQEVAPPIEIEAGLNGAVVSVRKGRGVIIEAYGGVLQGVWGNNRRAIGTIRLEPSDGMENIYGDMVEYAVSRRGAWSRGDRSSGSAFR